MDDTEALLTRAATDATALGELLTRHRPRLELMVRARLDPRVRGRIDPADVLQEASLEAAVRLPEFLRARPMPFFLWLRFLTAQRLLILHREHLAAQMRDARREVARPAASSAALAAGFVASLTSPSRAAQRAELTARVRAALDQLPDVDREVIALRHFEQLTNGEAAGELGLSESGASFRYAKAVLKLKDLLGDLRELFQS